VVSEAAVHPETMTTAATSVVVIILDGVRDVAGTGR
jgi:hypothetical protein